MTRAGRALTHPPGADPDVTFHRKAAALASRHSTAQQSLFSNAAAEKSCSVCKTVKPLADFYRSRRKAHGRMSECIECRRACAARAKDRGRSTVPPKEKACYKCGEVKPVAEFKPRAELHDGFVNYCRACGGAARKALAASRKGDPFHDSKRKRKRRGDNLRRYGLTMSQYEAMSESQGGLCAICGRHETAIATDGKTVRRLCVDHNHSTGQIRSLLCSACNKAIGEFGEGLDRMVSAVAYLARHAAIWAASGEAGGQVADHFEA